MTGTGDGAVAARGAFDHRRIDASYGPTVNVELDRGPEALTHVTVFMNGNGAAVSAASFHSALGVFLGRTPVTTDQLGFKINPFWHFRSIGGLRSLLKSLQLNLVADATHQTPHAPLKSRRIALAENLASPFLSLLFAVASFLVRSPRTSLGMMVELQDADALFPELDQEAFPQHDPFICKMDSDTLSILLDGFVPAQEATVHEGSITSATESVSSDQEAEEEEAAATLEGEAPFDAFAPPNLSNHWNLFPPGSVIGLDTTMKASFNPSSAGRGASKGPSAQRANASRKGRVSKRRNTSSAERPCTRARHRSLATLSSCPPPFHTLLIVTWPPFHTLLVVT